MVVEDADDYADAEQHDPLIQQGDQNTKPRASHTIEREERNGHDQALTIDDISIEEEEENDVEASAPQRFVWVLTFVAGLSGLLFGYEFVFSFIFLETHLLPFNLVLLYCSSAILSLFENVVENGANTLCSPSAVRA